MHLLTSDRETSKSPLLLQCLDFPDSAVAAEDNRVQNEAILETLYLLHHLCLLVGGTIVMNDTQATLKGHMNCHFMFGNSIHGGRDEWGLERDSLGDWRLQSDLGGSKANIARKDKEIIVGQTPMLLGVKNTFNVKPITLLVLFQHLEGLGVVQCVTEERARGSIAICAIGVRHLDK
jgi:hypothetical protein